ncbi:MAG: hypothetical protein CMC51_01665 [Flavobacteriaceae bacterium]|nr:hypothetical protein [Flavobacteriaceae bacterium]|tara:strand:- start:15807 stop:16169 length:363 start_codon:yes stop_codon:yes gene_type:complete
MKYINLFFVLILFGCNNNSLNTIQLTERCVIDEDWLFPNTLSPTSSWNFSADGTFSYSSSLLGGMSSWGKWEVLNPGEMNIQYTNTTSGIVPLDHIIRIPHCDTIIAESRSFVKDIKNKN